MKSLFTYCTVIVLILSLGFCTKKFGETTDPNTLESNDTVYTSPNSRNLDIIYFVPSDVDTVAGYHKRLSEVFLWIQNFYGKEMERNGFGYKTFGLLTDKSKGLIKIHVVHGTQQKYAYRYSGGSGNIQKEVNAYFATNPTEKTSQHIMVICPDFGVDSLGKKVGAPFYGVGRWCFAVDRPDMDVANIGTDSFPVGSFGGLAHELGHGLNLPHNAQKESERSNKITALMGSGNTTLTRSETILTKADCSILNVNEIFNNDANTYYGAVKAFINKVKANYDPAKSAILLSGTYVSDIPVKGIAYYNDPNINNEGTGGNTDYNAITWASAPLANDSFYIEMPIADLRFKEDNTQYALKVRLITENGRVVNNVFNYTWSGGVPVLAFNSLDEISKAGWTVIENNSAQLTTPVAQVIDGNPVTTWHSRWETDPIGKYPYIITLDLGDVKTVSAFTVLNGKGDGGGRFVKNVEVFTSMDNITYTSEGSYDLVRSNINTAYAFSGSKTFRYFRILMKSSHDGTQNAQLSEIGFMP